MHHEPSVVRAFVAGATGFTGREVVRGLCERQHGVFAHVRPDSRERAVWQERFTSMGATVDSTPWDESALEATLTAHAITHVFCCIGTTRARGKRAREHGAAPETYETVDYGLTAMLARATAAARPTARFIYLSATGASDGPGANSYLRWRHRAEEAVRTSGLTYVIARPSFITGARDEQRLAESVAARLGDAVLAVAGTLGAEKLRDRYRSTDNATLAQALIRVALDASPTSRVVEAEGLR